MLFGKNPFHRINKIVKVPNHFREYTARELTDYGTMVGLETEKIYFLNYKKDGEHIKNFLKIVSYPFKNFRQGLTVIYKAPL